jgi:hypothetical protein
MAQVAESIARSSDSAQAANVLQQLVHVKENEIA